MFFILKKNDDNYLVIINSIIESRKQAKLISVTKSLHFHKLPDSSIFVTFKMNNSDQSVVTRNVFKRISLFWKNASV